MNFPPGRNAAAGPAACALERINSFSVTRRAGRPARGGDPSEHRPGAGRTASQSKRGAEAAPGRAGGRPGRHREGATELWDPSGRRAGAARGEKLAGRGDGCRGARRRAGGRPGYSPRAGGRRAPRDGPGPGRRGAAGADAGVDVQGRPRAQAMNQLRGERRGAGITGKPRGRAEG